MKRRVLQFGVASAMIAAGLVAGGAALPERTVAAAGLPMQSVNSARLADTRPGQTTVDGQFAAIGRRPERTPTPIQIAGRGGVPADASAVMINLTSVQPEAPTFLRAYPCDRAMPNASNVNSPPNVDRANSVFVKLSHDGKVCIYNEAAGHFIIDVNGYIPAGGSTVAITPARLLDTRPGQSTIDGNYNGIGRRGPKSELVIKIAGRGGVPSDATAAVFNLTAEFPTAPTYLTAYPCGEARPEDVSNLNLPAGDTRANNVFVKLNAKGEVCIYTVAETSIIIDINGYVPPGGSPNSIFPVRLADGRPGEHTVDGQYLGFGRRGPRSETRVQVGGRGGVPSEATSALINLTAEKPSDGTYLTAYPCGETRPEPGSNLNLPADDTAANSVFVRLNAKGEVCIYTVAETSIIVDVNGYTTTPPVTTCTANSSIPYTECQALVAIYNATNGVNWLEQYGWLTATDPCTWDGITCDGGHVTEIDLSGNELSGRLPAQIAHLAGLTSLDLSVNSLTALPAEIGNLPQLTTLDLFDNELASLPPQFGNLSSLTTLDLSDNVLEGRLLPQIGNLTALTSLDLSLNSLTELPAEIGNLTQLTALDLFDNELASLPKQFGNLRNLTTLDLSDNVLSGDITAPFAPLKTANNLEELYLEGNGCLGTTSSSLANWLSDLDESWNDGC